MSVKDRLEEANILWESGKVEGAWIQVLIATASTARKRFPTLSDGQAFKKLIRQIAPTIIDQSFSPAYGGEIKIVFGSGVNAKKRDLDDVLYKHLRCYLLHEAKMPPDIGFSKSRIVNGRRESDLVVGKFLIIPDYYVLNLAKAISEAPENIADCGSLSFKIQ